MIRPRGAIGTPSTAPSRPQSSTKLARQCWEIVRFFPFALHFSTCLIIQPWRRLLGYVSTEICSPSFPCKSRFNFLLLRANPSALHARANHVGAVFVGAHGGENWQPRRLGLQFERRAQCVGGGWARLQSHRTPGDALHRG